MRPAELVLGLAEHGVVRSTSPVSFDEFEALCAELGVIRTMRDVRVATHRGRAFLRAPAVPLHADGDAQLVAWWCQEPDATGGETILVDSVAALKRLSSELLGRLREVCCLLSSMGGELYERPILHGEGCYWALSGAVDATLQTYAHREAVRAFVAALEAESVSGATRFVLQEGHFHIIDNRRILHGRTAIDPTSTRHLIRLWIESDVIASHPFFTEMCRDAGGTSKGTSP